jgi:hypothetical protein
MKKTILFVAIAIVGLTGCNIDENKALYENLNRSTLTAAPMYFVYPASGQQSVPTSTSIILRYTQPIFTAETDIAGQYSLVTSNGERLSFKSAELTENNQGVILTPETLLEPATDYVIISNISPSADNQLGSLPREPLTFRTAPTIDGPLMMQTDGNGSFSLQRIAPYSPANSSTILGSDKYPITDMSTLRLQFSEPVDNASLIYSLPENGGTVALINGKGQLVDASILAKGHRLTIDPKSDLNPDEDYQLVLSSEISSTISDTFLEPVALTVSPITTRSPEGVRERLAQRATSSGGEHLLTGKTNNSVGLDSVLLGVGNQTIQAGNLYAELGFIPEFERRDQSAPLRIEAGTKLTGTSVEVNVAGELPAGFESETVNVHFISDADGYLMPNPYTDDASAPRIIELYADLSLSTDNTIANGGLAQSLLHVQLVGTAIVEDGLIVLEATGIIEPDVLGVDSASSLISFRLEGFRNTGDITSTPSDVVSPTVKSWVPGENSDSLRPGDPVVIFFSEPLDSSSVSKNSVSISSNGMVIDGQLTLNGSAVTFSPSEPLAHNVNYTLNITNALSDLAGNSLSPVQKGFRLTDTTEMPEGAPANQAPLALTTQPGFPCAKSGAESEGILTSGHQGRCLGGNQSNDDLLPILDHPVKQPIKVVFSQNINPTSINADTVIVEIFKNDDWAREDVAITLENRQLTITPIRPWQSDSLYRYTLVSSLVSGDAGIKSSANLPLQTQFIDQGVRENNERLNGGPNMVNYFQARVMENRVLLTLKNLAAADVNGDLVIDEIEQGVSAENNFAPIKNSSNVIIPPDSVKSDPITLGGILPVFDDPVSDAQIGCEVDQECPGKKFIYLTSALDAAVTSEIIDGRVLVKLFPTTIYTSSVDVYVKVDDDLALLVGDIGAIPTGPMSMRMRFQKDSDEKRNELIDGFIFTNDEGQLTLETTIDIYLDAPYLAPEILGSTLDHNLRSFPVNGLKVRGPITFLDDGRMQIGQYNIEEVTLKDINIHGTVAAIGSINMSISMRIPKNGLFLNYLSPITQSH